MILSGVHDPNRSPKYPWVSGRCQKSDQILKVRIQGSPQFSGGQQLRYICYFVVTFNLFAMKTKHLQYFTQILQIISIKIDIDIDLYR